MRRSLLSLTLALTAVGCTGLSDMFSAHSNVAAEAAGHVLTPDSLANLMLEAKGARMTPETGEFLANLWIDYQLFGNAIATDGLKTDSVTVAEVMWPEISEAIGARWHDTLMAHRTAFGPGTCDSVYVASDSQAVRVMQHVLVRVQPTATAADA